MTIRAPFKILFLCTGNSARSIFGEYLIRKLGKGRFQSYSAGADPRPKVNPYALRVLLESFKIDASEAITFFGAASPAALATVVGVLVEVPVMLSVCNLCVRSQSWYDRSWQTA
jgi:Low molecular weight phosphotyrosine protein phosphatase